MASEVNVDKLQDVVLVLENNQSFYSEWMTQRWGYLGLIGAQCRKLCRFSPTTREATWIKGYFIERWGHHDNPKAIDDFKRTDGKVGAEWTSIPDGAVTYKPLYVQGDKPVAKFLETKTFLSGIDIATMPVDQLVSHLTAKEAVIENLEKVKTKPKRLQKVIDQHKAELAELVAYLDKQDEGTTKST